jgi:hypothetical protein
MANVRRGPLREHHVTVPLSSAEKTAVEEWAASIDLPVAALMRKALMEWISRQTEAGS